jgi:hypothetical protein
MILSITRIKSVIFLLNQIFIVTVVAKYLHPDTSSIATRINHEYTKL